MRSVCQSCGQLHLIRELWGKKGGLIREQSMGILKNEDFFSCYSRNIRRNVDVSQLHIIKAKYTLRQKASL